MLSQLKGLKHRLLPGKSWNLIEVDKIREVIKKQGFEIYSEEQKGDFTFIEAREI